MRAKILDFLRKITEKSFFKANLQNVPGLANLVFCSQGSLLDHDRCFRAVLENRHR